MSYVPNRRVLTVDDTPSIHEDYKKLLGAAADAGGQQHLAAARAAFFGKAEVAKPAVSELGSFEIQTALQGQEALDLVVRSKEQGRPFAVAFVDIRMPPGWDGVRTIQELWNVDPDLQCVICTAFSDYSWEQTVETLGRSDRLLILKKPFDPVEIRQLATALTEKWNSTARERDARLAIEAKEAEARAYAASLETANQALRTSKASADRAAETKRAFLERLTEDVAESLSRILDDLVHLGRTDELEQTLDRSQQLLDTVARALDLTRLEQGALSVSKVPCDVAAVAREVSEAQRPRAEAKGLTYDLRLAPDLPAAIECDPSRLREVLNQLVSNAIRFTDTGRVVLAIHNEPSASWDLVRVRFDVEDSGAGISAQQQGSLFEPFAARSCGKAEAGSGLGLAVAKQVARVLGGDITFEGGPRGGTVFHLSLESRRI